MATYFLCFRKTQGAIMRFSRLTIFAFVAILAVIALAAVIIKRPIGSSCVAPTCTQSSLPQEQSTLAKIRASGTITLGYRESSIPFSYLDDENHVIGYSQDLAKKIVERLKVELNLPNLKVNMVPITPRNRFAMIENGTIDLECGSTGNTPERQKLVAFSNSIFVVRMLLLTRKDYNIKDFSDLAGKPVVTTAGTTNVELVQKMNEEKKMGMNIIIAEDHREAFLALEDKRAMAFLMDDVLLYGERTRAIRWGDWIVTGTPQQYEAYGCIMKKNQPEFKLLVDQTIAAAMASGEVEKLYTKWFMSPIPPNGINLDFAMSDEMRKLVKSPNDKAM